MCILYKLFNYFYFRFKTSTGEDDGIHTAGEGMGQVFTHAKDDPLQLSDILPKNRIYDKMRPPKMAGTHILNITTM